MEQDGMGKGWSRRGHRDLAVVDPFQQYFSHIKMMKGVYEGLCTIKYQLHSDNIAPSGDLKPNNTKS